jgi:hypothetical protein
MRKGTVITVADMPDSVFIYTGVGWSYLRLDRCDGQLLVSSRGHKGEYRLHKPLCDVFGYNAFWYIGPNTTGIDLAPSHVVRDVYRALGTNAKHIMPKPRNVKSCK